MKMGLYLLLLLSPLTLLVAQAADKNVSGLDNSRISHYISDNDDGTYSNPIIFGDYSDPDVVRVKDDFYLVSSSFSHFPGLPILHSKDLVNWKIIAHAINKYPFEEFSVPQHGKGIWAPSIRYHNNEYWIFFGDPDHGIMMTKAKDPSGPWQPLHIVKEAKGWIDPCPLWDDDGNAYLVHAWAKSRAGFNSILTVNKMSPDGMNILDEGTEVFDGHANHPTIEGPKFYKKNGYYYIFAPAGGVTAGWQAVLRSKNIYGPYEDQIVLEQGSTNVNGPHQGAWVELENGDSWFIHFQDKGPYGRIVHLQPMQWKENWPLIGIDYDMNNIGEPVSVFRKPILNADNSNIFIQSSDEFKEPNLNLQWQWQANYDESWFSLNDENRSLRLFAVKNISGAVNLWDTPNILAQKLPAEEFDVIAKFSFHPDLASDRAGLLLFGNDYVSLQIKKKDNKKLISLVSCKNANKGEAEITIDSVMFDAEHIFLKSYIRKNAICTFSYSVDGKIFIPFDYEFKATEARWVGSKIGLFCINSIDSKSSGYTDIEFFKIIKF